MSKCPFWSTKKEKVNCDNECPMSPSNNNDEVCPFTEHLVSDKISYKELVQDDYDYTEKDNFDLIISSYVSIK